VKGRLFAASIGFCAVTFHAPSSSGVHQTAIWIIIGVVLAAAIVLASLVPRGQRAAQDRVCPGRLGTEPGPRGPSPRRVAARGRAAGEHRPTLLVVIKLVSVIGGTVPVPGGIAVAEAGMIAGFTSAGIPQDQAVAAVFIQRLFTACLPDLGMGHFAWMRRREYV
jgi:hypothetical protein